MATRGGRISLPLAVGVDRGHPQWPDLFFFFLAEKVVGEGGGQRRLLAGGQRWATQVAASGLIWLVD
jgi:hypothetical protein